MRYDTRAFVVLVITLTLAAGCSRASSGGGQRVTAVSGPPAPVIAASPPTGTSTTEALAPIPDHPPVTTSGVVASFDPATGILTFKDGRMVKVTERSRLLQPVDTRAVRPGEQVIVRNALPVGVQSASKAASGKRQRMATVASVDQANQTVRMTDGTSVRVTPSTRMRMGMGGETMVLTDLRPGDEVVIVLMDDGSRTTGTGATTSPSALPREAGSAMASDDASELMIFREPQTP